jgi:hypothetical protein
MHDLHRTTAPPHTARIPALGATRRAATPRRAPHHQPHCNSKATTTDAQRRLLHASPQRVPVHKLRGPQTCLSPTNAPQASLGTGARNTSSCTQTRRHGPASLLVASVVHPPLLDVTRRSLPFSRTNTPIEDAPTGAETQTERTQTPPRKAPRGSFVHPRIGVSAPFQALAPRLLFSSSSPREPAHTTHAGGQHGLAEPKALGLGSRTRTPGEMKEAVSCTCQPAPIEKSEPRPNSGEKGREGKEKKATKGIKIKIKQATRRTDPSSRRGTAPGTRAWGRRGWPSSCRRRAVRVA